MGKAEAGAGTGICDPADAFGRILTIRRFEELALRLHRAGHVSGSMHPCLGQEAAPVGACAALGPQDRVSATYRGHGWALALGVEPERLLAEILGRASGTNQGRGGSAYLTAPEQRFVGENSIVGAGLPIANGVALAMRHRDQGAISLVSFGDGATNQGAAHEALVFAVARSLPVIFVCENNGWSEMTPISAMVPVGLADRAAAGGVAAVKVEGHDAEAVAQAVAAARERALAGGGPTFVEATVGRLGGHYQADVEQYREQHDRDRAADLDPLPLARSRIPEEAAQRIEEQVAETLRQAEQAALAAPQPDPSTARLHVFGSAVAAEPAAGPARSAAEAAGGGAGTTGEAEMTYQASVNAALTRALETWPEALVFGEDVGVPGGVFAVTRGLQERFGAERVFDTPIAESAILGCALGASLQGLRPIAEIMWADFLLVALDQLVNQAANVRYLSSGRVCAPMVVRTQQGVTPGSCAQHSQALEAMLAHVPGLRVGLPATPADAYEMLLAAVAEDDPVVLIESRLLYGRKGAVALDGAIPPIGGARMARAGADAAIVTWGRMLHVCLEAAETLAQDGVECAVLDARWLCPLDMDAIARAVSPSGRLLVVHEAARTGGFGAEIVARVDELLWDDLDAPPHRLGLADSPVPAAPALQQALLPGVSDVQAAVKALLGS